MKLAATVTRVLGLSVLIAAGCSSSSPVDSPPDLLVKAQGREIVATLGSYCWDQGSALGCSDRIEAAVRELPQLEAPAGQLVIEFRTEADLVAELQVDVCNHVGAFGACDPLTSRSLELAGAVQLDVPEGRYRVEVALVADEGSAAYDLLLEVGI